MKNEQWFEVVIICSGCNVNEYKDYVADVVGEHGDATFKSNACMQRGSEGSE